MIPRSVGTPDQDRGRVVATPASAGVEKSAAGVPLTPVSKRNNGAGVTDEAILAVVLQALRTINAARPASSQVTVSPDAALFGPGSPLDSLALLTLLLDIEEDMQRAGCAVTLSDDRAMSQTRSPFRSVSSLVDYIGRIARE